MKSGLNIGAEHSESLKIDTSLTVPHVSRHFTSFKTMPDVFATAFLVGFVEWTCVELIKAFYDPDEDSVGTHINLSHEAATPIGDTATAKVKLETIEGRKLIFSYVCTDLSGVIGRGTHERAIIKRSKFDERLSAKAAELKPIS
jgi:fluoroacetyl-CoA thioesterase